jgi:hypothetical protein
MRHCCYNAAMVATTIEVLYFDGCPSRTRLGKA